jgi:hypothetical protein
MTIPPPQTSAAPSTPAAGPAAAAPAPAAGGKPASAAGDGGGAIGPDQAATAATDAAGVQFFEQAGIPPLALAVPESFHALPIAATEEERAALAEQFVRELYPEGDADLWTPAAPYYAAVGEALGEQGTAYSAMGLFRIDAGVAHCSFTVAAIPSDHASTEVAALGIREILVREETNDVRWLDLPCGPAVACVTLREIAIGAELTASGEEARIRMGQIQVYIPFPTGPHIAVITLDTAAVDYWGEFCDMMMAILRSVSFAEDDTDPAPGDGTDPATSAPADTAADSGVRPGAGSGAGTGTGPGAGTSAGTGTGTR